MEDSPESTSPSKSPTKRSPAKKAKRVYKKKAEIEIAPIPTSVTLSKAKCDNLAHLWTEANLTKIIDYLRKNGFHGEYEEVRKMFPINAISEGGLQRIFAQMGRWAEPIKEDPNER